MIFFLTLIFVTPFPNVQKNTDTVEYPPVSNQEGRQNYNLKKKHRTVSIPTRQKCSFLLEISKFSEVES